MADNATVDWVKLENHIKSGASWFFWIAGLSVINGVILLAGGSWNFIIGLGLTQLVSSLGTETMLAGKVIIMLVNIIIAGFFVLFGIFGRRHATWAFIVGIIIYALDGLLFLLVKDFVSIGFHIFALFFIVRGLSALTQLKKLPVANASTVPPANPVPPS